MQILKDKQEKTRIETIADSEQIIVELNHKFDREKILLNEDNTKLLSNINLVSFSFFFFF